MAYQYFKLSDTSIRLLALLPGRSEDTLRCLIFEAELSSNPNITLSFEALSYVWGDQSNSQPLYVVQPNGETNGTINLGPNLHSALHHLRLEQSRRIIWCDLICINQADVKEREEQIVRMADIYRNARRVIIWLGPEADESAIAMDAIAYTGSQVQAQPKRRTWNPIQNADSRFTWEARQLPHSQQELQAIQKLIGRSWFKRLWVRQEVTLGSSPVVMAGNHQVPWTHLVSAAAFIDEFIRLRGKTETEFGRDLFNVVEFGYLKSYEDIMDIFHACRACECTLDHDRVYAILGLLSSQRTLTIQPDYSKSAKYVYQEFVMQFYHHYQRLDILTLCEAAETPSWVPDFQKLRLNTGLNTRVAQYCWASGEAAASLVLSNNNRIVTYGVRCGILGKNVAPLIDKNSDTRVLKLAIVRILKDHMGQNVSHWDQSRLESLTKGLLGCLWNERTGRKNHARLSFAISELRRWTQEEPSDVSNRLSDEPESSVLLNHIVRVLFHGDSCRWTQDGYVGLGHNACQEGDHLYAILGCRRLIVLRKEPKTKQYQIVGKFDHPCYNDGEAFLGKLAAGWTANYRHLLLASNRPRFVHEHGSSQWQDPRLQGIALPDGWHEGEDQHGYPYWFMTGESNGRHTLSDPRLSYDELKKREIKIERLVIV